MITTTTTRPSKKSPVKDKKYDLEMARFYVSNALNHQHHEFVGKTVVNKAFADGDQWLFSEDLAAFLLDQSGGFRNRVRFINNIIKPIVRTYVGSAIKTDYSYKALPSSEKSLTRRQQKLQELLLMDWASKRTGSVVRDVLSQVMPIGESEPDTEAAFKKTYKDIYVDDINYLLKHVSTEVNDFEVLKIELIKSLVIHGIGVCLQLAKNKNLYNEKLDAAQFLFDRSARKPNLADAEYMGDWFYTYPSLLFDSVDLGEADKKALEEYVRTMGNIKDSTNVMSKYFGMMSGGVQVFRMSWKDIVRSEYGYVRDINGNIFYTRINTEDSSFTTKDLVESPESDRHIFNGKKSIFIDKEELRFCEYIPKEVIAAKNDIVLAHGRYPYQEDSIHNPSGVEFAYKVWTWDYANGKINSPIDDVISPQRFINRMLSMGESQFNNARPGGTFLTRRAINGIEGGEKTVQKQMNIGETITLNVDSVANETGQYQSTFGDGTVVLFNVANTIQQMAKESNGMNEAMMGNVGGKRELRGVVESMIQRGSLMIEDVFFALGKLLQSCYQGVVDQGCMVYKGSKIIVERTDDPLQLAAFTITDEHIREQFRIIVKRVVSEDEMLNQTNMILLQFLQLGLLDKNRVAKLFNRAGMDELAKAAIEYTEEEGVMQAEAAAAAESKAQQQEQYQQGVVSAQMQQADVMDNRKNISKLIGDLMKQQK